MKKLCAILAAAALAMGAGCAEEADAMDVTLANGAALKLNERMEFDLDGDGAAESVLVKTQGVAEEEMVCVFVTGADGAVSAYETTALYPRGMWVTDLDGDGRMEILISGDEMSDDFFTWCLRYDAAEGLTPVYFADANRGDNTDEYFDCGYGMITSIEGNQLTMTGSQDVLGTWMASRTFTLRDGRFELEDGGLWQMEGLEPEEENWEWGCLTLKAELPVNLEDGSEGALHSGDQFMVTQSDKTSIVYFRTRDGRRGSFPIAPDLEEGWGSLVNGQPEGDLFEFLPYAD